MTFTRKMVASYNHNKTSNNDKENGCLKIPYCTTETSFVLLFIVLSIFLTRVGISGTTAKSRERKFVPLSHPGPFAVVASSRKKPNKRRCSRLF